MASCDIPAQVWVLFSAAPNLQGLFWTSRRPPRPPYRVPLHLHLTNCALSHNTLSAFNYCLEVSGLKVTHSVCSACVHVPRMTAGRVLERNSTGLSLPLAHHVSHNLDPQLHQHRTLLLGVQMGFRRSRRHGHCEALGGQSCDYKILI